MGNYEQCLRIQDVQTTSGRFSGKHCMLRLCVSEREQCEDNIESTIAKSANLLDDPNNENVVMDDFYDKIKAVLNTSVCRVGACVPSTCGPRDVMEFMNGITAEFLKNQVHVNVEAAECIVAEKTEYTFIDHFTIAAFTFMLSLIVASTIYDLTHEDPASRNAMYVAFSAYTNLMKIMGTSENNDNTNLRCLHGIRFLSISYVVLAHTYDMSNSPVILNYANMNEFIKSEICAWVMGASFSVDTFFLLSGLLLSYVFLNVVAGKGFMDFKAFYIHRFVRLTPTMAAVLLFEYSLAKKLGGGPYWRDYYNDDCAEGGWWSVLLFARNWNTLSSCMFHTWYVAVDTQLYCLSPVLLIALWKNPRLGKKLLFGALFLSWIIPFIEAYSWHCRIPVGHHFFWNEDPIHTVHLYMGTENRFGPWIIGVGLGYVIHKIRSGKVTIKMSKIQVSLMWVYIIATFLLCIISTYSYLQPDQHYNRLLDSLYNSLLHLFWSTGMFFLIFACVTGNGGPVNWLLSLQLWVPVSRLTYVIYLVHWTVINMTVGSARTNPVFTHYDTIRKFLSNMMLSTFCAIVLSLMFESPLTAVEGVLLKKHSKVRPQKNTKVLLEDEKKLI